MGLVGGMSRYFVIARITDFMSGLALGLFVAFAGVEYEGPHRGLLEFLLLSASAILYSLVAVLSRTRTRAIDRPTNSSESTAGSASLSAGAQNRPVMGA
jgi:hypothetical protein